MRCAVCPREVYADLDPTYRIGECAGVVCHECSEGLGDAVRAWIVRRTRELAREERELRAAEQQRMRRWHELYPRGLRLVGVRNVNAGGGAR